jgi:uncharacterized protein YjiS (DUF1127 family)
MNASSTSTVQPSRPGTDPVFGQLGGLIRTTLRSLRLQWFLYRAQRRKVRALEPVGAMNAHLLRDIGVSNEMLFREAVETPAYERRGVPFGLAVLLLTLALDGAGTPAFAQTTARPADQTQCQLSSLPTAGVFAGEYVNGAPVYRFATVVVTGSRKERTPAGPKRHMRGSPPALTLMVAPGADASWARCVTPRNT